MPKKKNILLLSITGTVHAVGELGAEDLAMVPLGSPGVVLRLACGRNLALWGLTNEEARALSGAFMAYPVEVVVSPAPGGGA